MLCQADKNLLQSIKSCLKQNQNHWFTTFIIKSELKCNQSADYIFQTVVDETTILWTENYRGFILVFESIIRAIDDEIEWILLMQRYNPSWCIGGLHITPIRKIIPKTGIHFGSKWHIPSHIGICHFKYASYYSLTGTLSAHVILCSIIFWIFLKIQFGDSPKKNAHSLTEMYASFRDNFSNGCNVEPPYGP